MIKKYFASIGIKRFLYLLLGHVFIGMGVSIFKLAQLGNDAFNGMVMSLSDCTGIAYGTFFVIVSAVLFVIQLLAGRELIGIGTLVNLLLQGYIAAFFYELGLQLALVPKGLLMQIVVMCIGVAVCSFGVSMYQYSNAGVASYDSLSLILAKKIKKVLYFWWRILTDGTCAVICYLSGGLIGIGMLVATFGLGPFIQFYNVHIMNRLMLEKKKNRNE